MLSVRCRAYSGLESGKLEKTSEEHELGDDDDVVDDNSQSKFVRNQYIISVEFKHLKTIIGTGKLLLLLSLSSCLRADVVNTSFLHSAFSCSVTFHG